jgi:hypothetical protein
LVLLSGLGRERPPWFEAWVALREPARHAAVILYDSLDAGLAGSGPLLARLQEIDRYRCVPLDAPGKAVRTMVLQQGHLSGNEAQPTPVHPA